MSTRRLYLLAFIFIGIAVLFYVFNREKTKQAVATHSDIDFSATTIVATQTDDQGLIQHTLNADSLRHYPEDDRMELDRVTSFLYKQGVPQSTIVADHAVSLKNNIKVILTGNVHVQQLASYQHAATDLYTTILYGYPKTKKIDTDQVVTIKSAQSNLVSQGVRADLNTGQYEFSKPRGIYLAAPHP
jgi:lipopolysaccharide export system protein LptC